MHQPRLSLPLFSTIDQAQIEPQLDAILADNRRQLAGLVSRAEAGEPVSWDGFALPMQAMETHLEDFWSPVSHLNAVANRKEFRETYQRCVDKLTQYASALGQDAGLFRCYQALAKSSDFAGFTKAQQRWVNKALIDFHLCGVDLDPSRQQRFREIKSRLAELSQKFANHLLDATAAWQKCLEDVQQLAGLPDSALMMLRQMAEAKEMEGMLLTLDFPVYQAVVTYADNRDLRREIYLAYMTRASDQGPDAGKFDNSALMVDILNLRHELSALLGYEDYAAFSLVNKMANTADEVTVFLEDLAEKARPFAEKELALLTRYAKDELGLESVGAWDIPYISERYRQQHFRLADEKLREYFPLEKTLQGLFAIVNRLFGIEIRQASGFDSYHPDVRLYRIERNGEHIASFYLDLFTRENKRGGAWMSDCRSRWLAADNRLQLPVAFLACNFRPATGNQPALLGHSEVTTLFHEFGHGLHHMLTAGQVAGVSGIAGVEWDAVELPSQFMENWCWQEESIRLISAHYLTGEPLPQDMLGNMLAARNFNAGMMMLRQLEFSLFDMKLHCESPIKNEGEIRQLLDRVRRQVAVIIPPAEVRFQHGFSHIFAGGYAAGYYSYKWAEILSADAFSLFEERGLFDKESGQSFLRNILEVGSARSAAESFRAFRGRDPDTNALLRHNGLSGGEK